MNEEKHTKGNEYHEWMKHRGWNKKWWNLEDVHVIVAAFPQPHPATIVPLTDPGPPVLGSDFLDPNEDCTKCEICVGDFATHSDDTITVCAGVLVEEIGEGVKLIPDSLPGLFPLRRSKLGGGLLGLGTHEMSTAALREPEMSHGDHDWKKGLCEDFVDVVDEEALKSARPFRKDRPSRVRVFEVFGNVVGVGERLPAAGIVDNGESVNWPIVGAIRGRGDVQLTKNTLNVGRLDPVRAVWKTFVIENKSACGGHFTVYNE